MNGIYKPEERPLVDVNVSVDATKISDIPEFEKPVWLSSPTMHGEELKYMTQAYETNWMSTIGENINEAERLACEQTGSRYAVGLNCGTSAIHLAVIGHGVTIGGGTVVMAGAVINPCAVIGKGCIINTCASVDHDCAVGDYAHVSVGARIAGTVTIGAGTWIGVGAAVKNNVSIAPDCMIGAGAVVVKDIRETGTYIGIPARKAAGRAAEEHGL